MNLLKRLWLDDVAAVISTEFILLSGVLITGIGVGAASLRDSVNNSFKQIGTNMEAVIPKDMGYLINSGNKNVNSQSQTQMLHNYNHIIINPRSP